MTQRPSRDLIVVSTSRCGRDNPGSNPGHGSADVYGGSIFLYPFYFFHVATLFYLVFAHFIDNINTFYFAKRALFSLLSYIDLGKHLKKRKQIVKLKKVLTNKS